MIVFGTFERCRQIDGWLRQSLVPALPVATRLLVVSRDAPVPQWALLDPPRAMQASTALPALDEHAARRMLSALGVQEDDQAAAVRFTQGHPLALRLAVRLAPRIDRALRWVLSRLRDEAKYGRGADVYQKASE